MELLITRQHEICVALPAALLWWHTEQRRPDTLKGDSSQAGAGQAFGWENRHPEGPEKDWVLARRAGAGSSGTLRTPEDPPHSSFRPLHLTFLLLLPHSSEVFLGRTYPNHPTSPYRPFWPQCQLLQLLAHTNSPYGRSTLPLPALPPPGCSCSGVSRRAVLSLQVLPAARCPRAAVAALPPAGLGGGALRAVQLLAGTLCAAVGQ